MVIALLDATYNTLLSKLGTPCRDGVILSKVEEIKGEQRFRKYESVKTLTFKQKVEQQIKELSINKYLLGNTFTFMFSLY